MRRRGRYGRLPLITLTAVGAILLTFLLVRIGVLGLRRQYLFTGVLLLIALANLFWWAWVDGGLRSAGTSEGPRPGRRRWLRLAWAVYILAVLSPFVLVKLGGRALWDSMPVPVIVWTLNWHLLMTLLASAVAVGASVIVLWRIATGAQDRLARRRRSVPEPLAPPASDEPRLSRRALLWQSTAVAPLAITGTALVAGTAQAGRFRVRKVAISAPRLPDRLRGLTITHVSDLHVGRLFRPEHLPAMVDAANGLRSDLVVITGDLVDHSNDFLPDVCDAIAQLEHRYGKLTVIGNHDLIDDPAALLTELEGRGDAVGFLRARSLPRIIGGETVQVAGLDWSGREIDHVTAADAALARCAPDRFTVALAHHPHAFDALADRGVDLTLAGHTHGGQLMLPEWGGRPGFGVGSLIFRYLHGVYRRGSGYLYVNSGVGNWFPVRLNAPAEIVQIQLT